MIKGREANIGTMKICHPAYIRGRRRKKSRNFPIMIEPGPPCVENEYPMPLATETRTNMASMNLNLEPKWLKYAINYLFLS